MGSSEFLSKHTMSFLSKVGNIPVVQLKMDPQTLYCPFVTEKGCGVYENRPWACRMFPLDISSGDSKFRIIVEEARCRGLCEPSSRSVSDWLLSQGVAQYAEMDREFQSVVPEGFKPGCPMNEGLGRLLFIAYDLDRFAELLADNRFLMFHNVDDNLLALVKKDAKELLRLAFRYIRAQMDELYHFV
jgi:hypothetical protein